MPWENLAGAACWAAFLSFRLPPQLAFLFYTALLLAAAVPIALGWAHAVPADDADDPPPAPNPPLLLLFLVSLSYVAQVPGAPMEELQRWSLCYFPPGWAPWLIFSVQIILILIPALAALYAAFRTQPISQPLLWSGLLVALLWLAAPFLTASWLASVFF